MGKVTICDKLISALCLANAYVSTRMPTEQLAAKFELAPTTVKRRLSYFNESPGDFTKYLGVAPIITESLAIYIDSVKKEHLNTGRSLGGTNTSQQYEQTRNSQGLITGNRKKG